MPTVRPKSDLGTNTMRYQDFVCKMRLDTAIGRYPDVSST